MRLSIRRTGRKIFFVLAFMVIGYFAVLAARAVELPSYVFEEVLALLVVSAVYDVATQKRKS